MPVHGGAAAHWVGDAVPQEVGRLRAALGAFVGANGAPDALVEDVRLAVAEAVTNAVIHAYPGGAQGRLAAHASSEPATGVVTLRDYGVGCRPRADSPGLGAGIAVMTALARTIEIASPADGGTEVCLTFAVPRGAGA
jgi:serine/threonine-protein kinase RsbW/stage II sporulation protein AB (anti-sigma F factor)